MRFLSPVARILLAATLAGGASTAVAAEPVHDHSAHATAKMSLDHGRKWATDQPLRDGMSAMRAAVAAQLPAIHRSTLDDAGYAALATSLETSMAGIFANCRLGPAADIQLHNVLVPMHAAIGRMKDGPDAASRRAAALEVIAGLGAYGKHFDHPGWKPLAH